MLSEVSYVKGHLDLPDTYLMIFVARKHAVHIGPGVYRSYDLHVKMGGALPSNRRMLGSCYFPPFYLPTVPLVVHYRRLSWVEPSY